VAKYEDIADKSETTIRISKSVLTGSEGIFGEGLSADEGPSSAVERMS